MALSENNPELLVMQVQVLTNWVVFHGATYGMKYAGKITALYENISSLDSKNP